MASVKIRSLTCSNGNAKSDHSFLPMNATSSKIAALGASPRQLSGFLGRAQHWLTTLYFSLCRENMRSLFRTTINLKSGCFPSAFNQKMYCFAALISSTDLSRLVLYTVKIRPPSGHATATAARNLDNVDVLPCCRFVIQQTFWAPSSTMVGSMMLQSDWCAPGAMMCKCEAVRRIKML